MNSDLSLRNNKMRKQVFLLEDKVKLLSPILEGKKGQLSPGKHVT